MGLRGETPRDVEKFKTLIENLELGDVVKLTNYTLDGITPKAGTLGRFTIIVNGVISFDKENKYDWNFAGRCIILTYMTLKRDAKTDKGEEKVLIGQIGR